MDSTMNLISGTYHLCGGTHYSCERGTTYLFVVLNFGSNQVNQLDQITRVCAHSYPWELPPNGGSKNFFSREFIKKLRTYRHHNIYIYMKFYNFLLRGFLCINQHQIISLSNVKTKKYTYRLLILSLRKFIKQIKYT